MDPLISIIIPVHNQVGYLLSCLRSIREAETKATYEILVVDDQSSSDSANELDQIQGVRLIRNYDNIGFLRSCNRGAVNAKGTFLAFLNSDTEVTTLWLDELLNVFERIPNAGLVGSKLIYPNGTLQECGGIVWNNASACNFGRGNNPNLPEYNYTKTVDYVSAASLLIKKTFFIECGLFDRRYAPAYYEDTDLAFTVRAFGKQVYVEPKSVVIHHEGISNGICIESGIKKNQELNRDKFYKKWTDTLKSDHAEPGDDFFLRRDRSAEKKHILVVDHYVPTYDRDAGSRCIFMYLKLLLDLGLAVTFLPHNRGRPLPYSDTLEKRGIEILYGKYDNDNWKEWMKTHLDRFDFVFLSRPNIAIHYISEIRRHTTAKLIFFGHDIHHLRLEREKELGVSIEQAHIDAVKTQELEVWEACDTLIYPSQEEVNYCAELSGNTNVAEAPIFFFDPPQERRHLDFSQRIGILFVANFNHPPNKDGLHWFFDKVYPSILESIPDIAITIVGSAIPVEILRYGTGNIRILANVSDSDLAKEYAFSRIAIAPLRFGAGVKGKVLESLYNELPIVTTSYGAQGIPNLSKCASVADNPKGFAFECVKLYTNRETWQLSHDRSLEILLQKFSYSNAKKLMESVLSLGEVSKREKHQSVRLVL